MRKRTDLTTLREEYARASLDVHGVANDPIEQFSAWFEDAREAETGEPNAMALATVDGNGAPSCRIVLLKTVDERGFTFFTNYESRKSTDIESNPNVSLVLYWSTLERQVRIDGVAERVDAEESSAYFAVRPRGSQLGAWASPQSRMVASRQILEERLTEMEARFDGREVPRPSHWGGFLVTPRRIEFWQGRPNRLHDRVVYDREEDGRWTITRLAP